MIAAHERSEHHVMNADLKALPCAAAVSSVAVWFNRARVMPLVHVGQGQLLSMGSRSAAYLRKPVGLGLSNETYET